ncbi:hypothetical protein MKP05_20570 [Halomonas sp. EGI 63088]|uniref:Uncharacterized protein n=1 Tax=Halomonas flagellata TaxID=2920385 RepID=A0ABS9S068_9GAMM|nr:hypothetical protein [Halomonas flagellata]MCH4565495.1 hypothetical protein [Halomonas flagellata]
MHMQVRHCLVACRPMVEADIVAIRTMALVEVSLRIEHRREKRRLCLGTEFGNRRDVSVGDHQGMPRRHGEAIPIHEEVRVPGDDPGTFRMAEGAFGAGVAFHA